MNRLQAVLAALLDPVHQLFFHSRMLRAWGHSRGMDYHEFWVAEMRRAAALVEAMARCGILPPDRPAASLTIGAGPAAIFAADAGLASRCASAARAAAAPAHARGIVADIAEAEREFHAGLQAWMSGPEAGETASVVKHLRPREDGAGKAVCAINRVLPHMTAAVSQIFLHSLLLGCDGRREAAKRELDAAVAMMFRAEALLERLLDLGGLPAESGHGRIRITGGAKATALEAHEEIIAALEPALASLDGLSDPMTHTLFDGILLAERRERDALIERS